jgi:hypothetical protein
MCEQSEAEYITAWERCEKLSKARHEEAIQSNKPVWKCNDGREFTPDQMNLSHIINSIWMLIRNGFSAEEMEFIHYDPEHTGDMAALSLDDWNWRAAKNKYTPWFNIFYDELKTRGFTQEQIDSWCEDVYSEHNRLL